MAVIQYGAVRVHRKTNIVVFVVAVRCPLVMIMYDSDMGLSSAKRPSGTGHKTEHTRRMPRKNEK